MPVFPQPSQGLQLPRRTAESRCGILAQCGGPMAVGFPWSGLLGSAALAAYEALGHSLRYGRVPTPQWGFS
jgi:hypothetical protein